MKTEPTQRVLPGPLGADGPLNRERAFRGGTAVCHRSSEVHLFFPKFDVFFSFIDNGQKGLRCDVITYPFVPPSVKTE